MYNCMSKPILPKTLITHNLFLFSDLLGFFCKLYFYCFLLKWSHLKRKKKKENILDRKCFLVCEPDNNNYRAMKTTDIYKAKKELLLTVLTVCYAKRFTFYFLLFYLELIFTLFYAYLINNALANQDIIIKE